MHCVHDITPTISEMATTVSVSSRLHWWSQTNCMYGITPTLPMPSYALYKSSYPLFMTSHHCSYHITSTAFMRSHTLYMTSHTWQYKRYICHWPTISNTTSTVSVSSNPGYHLYHTHSLYDITHTIRVTSYSVCMLSQQLIMTLYPSMYNITPSIFMTSYPLCTLSPYCFHDNTTTIPDMSPTIFDTAATVSVSPHKWHRHLYQCSAVSMTSKQVCKSSHWAHVWHHTQSTSHHIHTLWHQWSCSMTSQTLHSWHQISSIWHHIHFLVHHTTLCVTSTPLYLTSRPLYLCHDTHAIDDVTASIWMVSHPVYLWHHIPRI